MSHTIRCLHPGCDRIALTRGRCPSHYTTAAANHRAGKVTWAELEALGEAVPLDVTKRLARTRRYTNRRP